MTDWKDSRLVIAALSVAGAATFMSTVVMPIANASLNAKLEALQPVEEKMDALRRELAATKDRLAKAEAVAALATKETPFLPGSVYPTQLDRVVLGATAEHVLSVFPAAQWDEDKAYLSVETAAPHFRRVTYFLDGKPGSQRVGSILFQLHGESGLDTVRLTERFTVLFGLPAMTASKGRALWRATPRETIVVQGHIQGFSVERANHKVYW